MTKISKSLLIALAASLLVLAVAMLAARPITEAATLKPFPLRQFYLTTGTFDGLNTPQKACSTGYHMASLWEIFDVSNLRYNTVLGLTTADSGSGPSSGTQNGGWIRTGYQADASATSGQGNCQAWSTNSGSSLGGYANLNSNWNPSPAATLVDPWIAFTAGCDLSQHVWCVQD
jgi:hypothetical protein